MANRKLLKEEYYSFYYTKGETLKPETAEDIEKLTDELFGSKSLRYIDLHENRIRLVVSVPDFFVMVNFGWKQHCLEYVGATDTELIEKIEKVRSEIDEPIMISKIHPISYLILKGLAQGGELGDIKDINVFNH